MNRKLENKVAVVTGGSAGIGFGAAKRFAEEGARVFITGRRQSELDKAVATIEGNITAIQGDASNLADIDRIYETVKAQAGRIDVLFVNAGFYEFGKFGEITEEHFDKTFNTNVRGLLFAVQKALPLLSQGSSVILNGSIASIKGFEATAYLEVGLIAAPGIADRLLVDLPAFLELWNVAHDPTQDRARGDADAEFPGQLGQIPVTKLKTQVPAHTGDDNVVGEPTLTKEWMTG